MVWFIDDKDHNTYLSMVFTTPMLGSPCFNCFAGEPPANLKTEGPEAQYLVKDEVIKAPDGSCEWTFNDSGVNVTIPEELSTYKPCTSADVGFSVIPPVDPNQLKITGDAEVEGDDGQEAKDQSLLAKSRPRDAGDGIKQGLAAAGSGIVCGLTTVVAAPVMGAQAEGTLGFLKGVGLGLLGGTAMVVGGLAVGTAQIGRGIWQIPAARKARMEEKIWDPEIGEWVDINLCELEALVGAMEDQPTPRRTKAVTVKEKEFYDLLKVEPGVSPSEIKRAYYKEARACHPDKNPDDEAATAKFQELSEVYQVLSNPELRKKYDREGKDAVKDDKNMQLNPVAFFAILFGSERFLPWTGELNIAMTADHFAKQAAETKDKGKVSKGRASEKEKDAEKDAEKEQEATEESEEDDRLREESEQALKQRQLKREVQLAVHLREKTAQAVFGRDEKGFDELIRAEAEELAKSHFGPQLLIALGAVYYSRAEIHIANEMYGRHSMAKRAAHVKNDFRNVQHGVEFLTSTAVAIGHTKRLYIAANKLQDNKNPQGKTEDDAFVVGDDAQALRKDGTWAPGKIEATLAGNKFMVAWDDGDTDERLQPRKHIRRPKIAEEPGAPADEDVEKVFKQALPAFLQTAWMFVVRDIDSTMKQVSRKFLQDKSVPWQMRIRRAQALQRLGEIFSEVGASKEQDEIPTDAQALFQEAVLGAMKKE